MEEKRRFILPKKAVVIIPWLVAAMIYLLGGKGYKHLNAREINSFIDDSQVPDGVTYCVRSCDDGAYRLMGIRDGAREKFMYNWASFGKGRVKLTGRYDGVWYYGLADEDCLFYAKGTDKKEVYGFMKQFSKYKF